MSQIPSFEKNIIVFATGYCPYCVQAENHLRSKGVSSMVKVMVDETPDLRSEMTRISGGRRTVSQIFINGRHIEGCDDLLALGRTKPAELGELIWQCS